MNMDAQVGIIMGSRSDWETMRHASEMLDSLGIPHDVRVVSAHRTPDLLFEYAASAVDRGLQVIIAGAGGAAHLPGMAASKCRLPVIGVPIESKALKGMDSLSTSPEASKVISSREAGPASTMAVRSSDTFRMLTCLSAACNSNHDM